MQLASGTTAFPRTTSWHTPLFWRMCLLYLGVTAALFAVVQQGSAGFSYSLDDPYIHMALAQRIAHGTYGVNARETTSPASSVVWPFLLAPFANTAVRAWMPLLLNCLAGLGICALCGRLLRDFGQRVEQEMSVAGRWLLALLFVIAANLPALALLGMEHTLQVLCAAGCAFGIAQAYYGRRVDGWCLLCAALAPALRYEDLAFTLAVCLVCWQQRRRIAAIATAAISPLPLLALGLFLHRHGLGFLPNSVIVKGGVISAHPHLLRQMPLLDHFLTIVAVNGLAYLTVPQRWPITALLVLLCVQLWRVRREPAQRMALASAIAGLLLIMALGPYGYFFRYDVAYRFFAFLVVFAVAARSVWFGPWRATALAALAAMVYVIATMQTPAACWAIAHQQKQMQRFSDDFYRGNIAVNDLGWVSYDSRDRFYILDVAGLASNEAAYQRNKDAAWLDGIVRKHHAGLAMIYPYWFQSVPADWTAVAVLHRYGDGPNQVTFYATQVGDAVLIRKELEAFAPTLPNGSWLTYADGRRSDIEAQ